MAVRHRGQSMGEYSIDNRRSVMATESAIGDRGIPTFSAAF
jgi:hypothetical protein